MSIGPIQIILPVAEDQPVPGRQPTQPSNEDFASELGPKPETTANQEVGAAPSIPPEEVKVQRDSGTGERISQCIDRSGSVILQIPSEQMLNFIRDIQHQQARIVSNELAGHDSDTRRRGNHGDFA